MSLKGEKQILLKNLNYENVDIMNSPETALVWQPDNNVEYPTMTQVLLWLASRSTYNKRSC